MPLLLAGAGGHCPFCSLARGWVWGCPWVIRGEGIPRRAARLWVPAFAGTTVGVCGTGERCRWRRGALRQAQGERIRGARLRWGGRWGCPTRRPSGFLPSQE